MSSNRVSITTLKPSSGLNRFSPPSTPSSQLSIHHEITANHERKVVLEIVDRIFDEKTGIYSVSSSACSTPKHSSSEYSYDQRLHYWKESLADRKEIARRIECIAKKPLDDVLFNRISTVDEPDKEMVKRVMDYGDRLNPIALLNKRLARLRGYCNMRTCLYVNEIDETMPQAEKNKRKIVEVIGMPKITREEQLGQTEDPCKKSMWLNSDVLEKRIEKKRKDIERVIEFYPDIEHLQVVGESMLKGSVVKHNSEIHLLEEDVIKSVSSETQDNVETCKGDPKLEKADEPISFGIKVNEHVYLMGMKRSAQHVEVEVRFECHPFEHVVKRVLRLENIGQKVLNIEFVQRNYYNKVQPLLRSTDSELVFDTNPFRLIAGEKRDIFVLYRPRKVDVVKQQWLLKIEPQFFCRKSDAIMLRLSGRCKPPVEYAEKISGILHDVVEKSNNKMMRKLGTNLGGMAPLHQPDERICPYQRILDERELFEQINIGYKCERYHDLELLKDIYKRLKKPREPAWDFNLETLKNTIMRLDSPDRRALVFNEMMGILDGMKGVPVDLAVKVEDNPDRERSRFLYVRGALSTGIDEWEDLRLTMEETFVTQAVKLFHARESMGRTAAAAEEAGDAPSMAHMIFFNEEEIWEYMSKKVRRQKAFRDSLYVRTYSHLCNFIEDIVSVIESTEVV